MRRWGAGLWDLHPPPKRRKISIDHRGLLPAVALTHSLCNDLYWLKEFCMIWQHQVHWQRPVGDFNWRLLLWEILCETEQSSDTKEAWRKKRKEKKSAQHFQETEARSQPSFAFLYAFTLSVAGWEGDPLGGPPGPSKFCSCLSSLGFQYLSLGMNYVQA